MAWIGGEYFWAEKHMYKPSSGGAKRIKGLPQKINYPTTPRIKWVKKANAWCKTWFEKEVQKQTWTFDRPEING